MSRAPSDASGSDPVFFDFQRGFEEAIDRAAFLEQMCTRHPERAREFRDYAQVVGLVRETVGPAEEAVPETLGEFRLKRRIGRGMSEVYEAWQPSLRRRVAVKVVRQGRTSPAARERFEREQRVLAKLHQTHIVPIHAAGEEGPIQYFVMPYIDGASLHHVVHTTRSLGSRQGGSTPPLSKLAELTASRQGRPTVSPSAAAQEENSESEIPIEPVNGKASERPRLSADYFRSVAEVMADAAEALEHAHQERVLHRDLKPANIMVDRDGHCWLIDFGLSGEAGAAPADRQANGPVTVSGVMGTPQYMAPEQWAGKADRTTDVYGLGVTMYELLTLRPAFDGGVFGEVERSVLEAKPPRPRLVSPNTPRDLEAICLKAMRREARQRYAAAGEVAADLRRWLGGEVTKARPAWVGRRMWLWARREPWRAAMAVLVPLLLVGVVVGGVAWAAAEQREKDRQHEALVLALQGERLTTRTSFGWFDRVWPKVQPAAAIRKDADLRSQAVATLQGMDAVMRKRWEKYNAYSLAFDAKGRLLMGGWRDMGARLWDGSILEPATSEQIGYGPAAFQRDGTALQLAFNEKDPYRFVLWNMTKQAALRTLEIPDTRGKKIPQGELPKMALSADGSLAAIAVKMPDSSELLTVWDTATGKLLHRFTVQTRSLAFSTPGEKGPEFLAAGQGDGGVTIWSLPKGEKVATMKVGKTPVTALAFGPDLRRDDGKAEKSGLSRWLLAVGEAGGNLSIREPETGAIRAFCHGSNLDVHAVAFSPDGMTLASAGRGEPRLWDASTGRLLLRLDIRSVTLALAFSPDGKRLAASSIEMFGTPGGIDVWEILPGRGVQSLRGLVGTLGKVAWSRNGRRLATVAHNWQVAVWDREASKLLHIFEPPPGMFIDNVGLAFSPDGKRLAFSTFRTALLWDLDTGKQLRSWALPIGFVDHLLYSGPDQLTLFRVETGNPEVPPFGVDHRKHPRICRIRNLFDKDAKPIEIKDFNRHVFRGAVSPSQSCFIAEGMHVVGNEEIRSIKAFDAKTGAVRWTVPSRKTADGSYLNIDPLGEFATAALREVSEYQVIEVSSGRLLLDRDGGLLGPKAAMRFDFGNAFSVGARATNPLFRIGIDGPDAGGKEFNDAGTHFAWTTIDGIVSVCDLAAVQEHLAAVGLEW